MSFLTLQGVGRRYGTVVALDGIDLDVPTASRTAIVGPSGSGKTTLLRLIAGFEAPDAGRIALDGRLLAEGSAAIPAHRRGIGFVPQDGALFPHLSVAANIGFGLDRGMARREERILELMDAVELDRSMRLRRPDELSGGQQQRVALARALARKPRLMLLDEPFSALDAGLRETMRKAVARVLAAAGITTILVTHDQAEALSFADQVVVLRAGRLVQVGSPQDLYLRPTDRGVAAFLGDAIVLPAELGDGVAECCLGRVAADTLDRRGAAEIMLRPEQIQLTPIEQEDWCCGRVAEVEFGGADCSVAVALLNCGHASGTTLLLRHSSLDLPGIGALVRITVQGRAHIFASRAEQAAS
jgi:iron(III) transport system ATP-binding protein